MRNDRAAPARNKKDCNRTDHLVWDWASLLPASQVSSSLQLDTQDGQRMKENVLSAQKESHQRILFSLSLVSLTGLSADMKIVLCLAECTFALLLPN